MDRSSDRLCREPRQTDADEADERPDLDAAPREDCAIPQGPPPLLHVDVWRSQTCSLIEVCPGTGPAELEHVSNAGQDRSSQTRKS
jgi:hypothetical protein